MKKSLFVVALAAMLVFAVTGSAFALIAHSGQQRTGAAATAPANVVNLGPGQTNPVPGAGTYTYLDWMTTAGGNNAANAGVTPHGNYTTTTVKCVVCHAVHYAAPGGAPVGDAAQSADTLLRMKASQSCVYCHASATGSVNGRPVYNGLGASFIDDGTQGHLTDANCSMCHTSVHGAGQDNSVAALRGYMLITLPNSMAVATGPGLVTTPAASANMLAAINLINIRSMNQGFANGQALNTGSGLPNDGTPFWYQTDTSARTREQAVGIFCAECHNGSYAQSAAGAAANIANSNSKLLSGHRVAAEATTDWNDSPKVSSSTLSGISVAWAAAIDCKDCHDSQDNFNKDAFPHAWGKWTGSVANSGSKMWLMSAPRAGATKTELQPVTTPYNQYTGNVGPLQLEDGVCLKCHINSSGAAGVGLTF